MRIKVYIPTFITIHKTTVEGQDDRFYANAQTGDPKRSWSEADGWNVQRLNYVQQHEMQEDGTKKFTGYTGSIVEVKQHIAETVIDTEDFSEYKPSYEVEISVKIEKRFTVEIDGDDIDHDDPEYSAEEIARDKFESGDYDDELEYADVWDSEFEVEDVNEI